MSDEDEICKKCGTAAENHFTSWKDGVPMVGSYRDAPKGRICSPDVGTIEHELGDLKELSGQAVNWLHATAPLHSCAREIHQLADELCAKVKSRKPIEQKKALANVADIIVKTVAEKRPAPVPKPKTINPNGHVSTCGCEQCF
jgi:hypothetical protein